MLRTANIWRFVTIVMVLASVAGCATGGAGTPVQIAAADMPKLEGTWQGSASLPGMGGQFGTLTIAPGGKTYQLSGGSITAGGTIEIKDGVLVTTNTSTSGLPPEKRTSQAVLTERGSVWVLTGYGQSDRGPFSYEFTKSK